MSHSTIMLGLGLGGGKSATSSGRLPSGGAFSNTLSASFDGTDDYLVIPDDPEFSMGDGLGNDNAFSISSWFNADSIGTFYMATKDASGNREWSFRTVSSQLHFFAFGTGGGYIGRKYATNLSAGQWYHAVVTYDASKASSGIKLYLNGSRVDDGDYASGTYTAAVNTTTSVRVGSVEVNNTFADGKVDELAIFDSQLSASDVTAIYNGGVPGDLSSLSPVGWWRMGDGTGDTDSGGGAPASGDTIGTVVNQGSASSSDATNPNGALYSNDIPVFNIYSVDFDGTNNYIDAGASPSSLTVEGLSVWFKPDVTYGSGTLGYLLSFGGSDDGIALGGNHFGPVTDEVITVVNANHLWSYTGSGVTLSANTWHHLGVRWESSSSSTNSGNAGYDIYLDGTKVGNSFGTYSSGNGSKIATSRITVGARNRSGTIGTYFFNGKTDEFSVFTSAISESDLLAIYNSGVPADLTAYSPALWWRMGDNDGGTGTTITDQGSGGNDGTLINSPTFSTDIPS